MEKIIELPCGCIRTEAPGHIHTKMCRECQRAAFGQPSEEVTPAWLEIETEEEKLKCES